jgi:hypothetical protein
LRALSPVWDAALNRNKAFTGRNNPTKDVAEADLEPLQELKELRRLYLGYGTHTTDVGLAHVGHLRKLEVLMLPETSITDDGLSHLESLRHLQKLGLLNCKGVTDAGLIHLRGLTSLREVSLFHRLRDVEKPRKPVRPVRRIKRVVRRPPDGARPAPAPGAPDASRVSVGRWAGRLPLGCKRVVSRRRENGDPSQ